MSWLTRVSRELTNHASRRLLDVGLADVDAALRTCAGNATSPQDLWRRASECILRLAIISSITSSSKYQYLNYQFR